MALLLAYDTETTGLPDFKAPSEAEHQPHMVQLAAALVDDQTRKIEQSIDLVIFPDGWVISPDIAAIHGITQEKAESIGVSEAIALQLLLGMAECCDYLVGHNEQFDRRIGRIACMRYQPDQADRWKEYKAHCTQQLATPILKLPPTPKMIAAGFNKHKSANLAEAYAHFIGKPMENAHNAMADVLACLAVFWAIQDQQKAA